MKSITTALALTTVLGMAACANNPNRPTDTGNMAFPAPQPAGNVGYSSPNSSGGVARPNTGGADTGNMALPNRAQGNSIPGRY